MISASKGRVLVAMSGGVDSSTTALLLQRAGYECVGVTMRLHGGRRIDPDQPACCSSDDAADASRIARRLGFPFHVLDFRDAFEEHVVNRFVAEYARGRTPNPCILCNRYLKFGLLFGKMREFGCDYVATGHYAQVCRDAAGVSHLVSGVDPKKDQSYVLYMLSQDQLSHLLLPLGELEKAQVRRIAQENGLDVAEKRESQDICFIPGGDYAAFLRREGVKGEPGDFVDQNGVAVGRHRGIANYTIGQRKGLGVAMGYPVYVTRIDAESNTVTVGPREALGVPEFAVSDLLWTSSAAPDAPFEADVRTHYHARRFGVVVHPDGERARVVATSAMDVVAPGQAAVFYRGNEVIGGGTIC